MSSIRLIETATLGECWHAVSGAILRDGDLARYDGAPIRELANVSMAIAQPDPADAVIQQYGDPAWLEWMHANFFVQTPVPELGNAASYATRLFNYGNVGRDQIHWVIQRLHDHAEARSAAISTFQPLTDTSYIPCISLLDFWRPHDAVELVVYAHSLDFGKKAYGNLIELASLQMMVADALECPLGKLIIHCKTVHIYEPEWEYMAGLLQEMDGAGFFRTDHDPPQQILTAIV